MNKDPFYSLSSPYRREILRLLKWQNMNAGDISEKFNISKPSVSRHLEVLKYSGLISDEKRGNQIIYSLNLDAMESLKKEFEDLFKI